jgi:hypothetical protein
MANRSESRITAASALVLIIGAAAAAAAESGGDGSMTYIMPSVRVADEAPRLAEVGMKRASGARTLAGENTKTIHPS